MLANLERDHCIAIAAWAGLTFTWNADLLASNQTWRQFEFHRLSVAQCYPLRLLLCRVGEAHQMFIGNICALGRRPRLRPATRPARSGTSAAAEQAIEDIAKVYAPAKFEAALPWPSAACAKGAATAETPAKGGTGLPVFVDLTAIILSALLRI
jgi:hypothetical protein